MWDLNEYYIHLDLLQIQLVDDLNYYHGIDAEAELTRLMSEHIVEEIDNEVINILTGRINGGNRA